MRRTVINVAAGVAALAGSPAGVPAQAPQPPAFRTGVELVAVDVNIVDRRGNPVPHLGPDQFEVTIDGKPRRVVTAEFIEYAKANAESGTSTTPAPPVRRLFTTNEDAAQASSPGRLVVLAVDQGSFRAFGAQAAMEAARRFIDRLQPVDRVGLVAFPPPGPQVAPSRNHAAAREMTLRMVGTAAPFSGTASAVHVTLGEAIDIRAGDDMTLDRVMDRECPGASGSGLQYCRQMVTSEAASIGMGAEMQATRSLWGLEAVIKGLTAIRERKTLVLVSAGLPVSDRSGADLQLNQRVAELGRLAAAANLNLYVLHVDTSFLDAFSASERTVSDTLWRDMGMMSAGLETIAGASGGSLARVVAGADFAFDRVLRETSAAYLLGVEPVEADRDGRAHRIAVKVKLPGVEVRSRREVLLPKAAPPPASPEETLAEALQSPRVATDLPVRVSTLTMAAETAGALRVLITADIGSARTSPVMMRVGYVIDAAGEVKASAGQGLSLTPRPTSGAGALSYLVDMHLEPGAYTLRLAASDPAGKMGSVEHAFTVGLTEGTGVQIGDLLLLDSLRTRDEASAPVTDGELSGRSVDAYVEARPTSMQAAVTGVTFGISDTPDGAPLVSLPVAVIRDDARAPWAAAGRLDLDPLPPGDYTAFASLTNGTEVVGRVTRPLRIGRSAPATILPGSPAGASPRVSFASGVSGSLVKAFSRDSVLQPDALTYFLGRLDSTDPKGASAPVSRAAADAIRKGRYDEALATLSSASADELAATFLTGLALFGKGELEPAAGKFLEALSHTPEFLPAVFYLGACYAAGGRDREAAGAWQAALITEADARIVYDVLGDALLRLRDAEQADGLLAEARDKWADDDGFVPRMAVAKVLMERRDEALAMLEPFIAAHPDDAEVIFLALRLLYESASADGAASPARTATAEQYAALYRQAGGDAVPLVDQWLAFIKRW